MMRRIYGAVWLMGMLLSSGPARVLGQHPTTPPAKPPPRAAWLEEHTSTAHTHHLLEIGLAAGTALIGTVGVVGMVADGGLKTQPGTLLTATAGVMALGGAAALVVPDAATSTVLLSTSYAGMGTLWLSLGVGHDHLQNSLMALSAGAYATAALAAVSGAIRLPTPASRLAADHEWLRNARDDELTEEKLDEIERRLRLSEPALPFLVIMAPMLAGSTAAVAISALDSRLTPAQRRAGVGSSLATLMMGCLPLLTRSRYARYRSQRKRATPQVALVPGPGALSLVLARAL